VGTNKLLELIGRSTDVAAQICKCYIDDHRKIENRDTCF